MASVLRYVSHPEVLIDPAVPVPEWELSEVGRSRVQTLAAQAWVADLGRVVSSSEPKAIATTNTRPKPTACSAHHTRARRVGNERSTLRLG